MHKMKIFYIMNVNWNWIKQRPHFIAEELTKKYGPENVLIVHMETFNRKGLQHRNNQNLNLIGIRVIPFISRFKKLKIINDYLYTIKVKRLIKKFRPNYIYTTNINMSKYVPKKSHISVIYDCMDDNISTYEIGIPREKAMKEERELYNLSSFVLASSDSLREKLINRYGEKNIEIVRNAFAGNVLQLTENEENKKEVFSLCYFGTIAEWFNWDYIIKSINDFENIEYLLIGPLATGVTIPSHPRIHYLGTVEHDKLYETTKNIDCFIMPFILNELILSVDPVKVYEYINFNKNILMVRYPEVERFEPFVCFYNTYDEYEAEIKKLLGNSKVKYSQEQRLDFLKNNGWASRSNQIIKLIEK